MEQLPAVGTYRDAEPAPKQPRPQVRAPVSVPRLSYVECRGNAMPHNGVLAVNSTRRTRTTTPQEPITDYSERSAGIHRNGGRIPLGGCGDPPRWPGGARGVCAAAPPGRSGSSHDVTGRREGAEAGRRHGRAASTAAVARRRSLAEVRRLPRPLPHHGRERRGRQFGARVPWGATGHGQPAHRAVSPPGDLGQAGEQRDHRHVAGQVAYRSFRAGTRRSHVQRPHQPHRDGVLPPDHRGAASLCGAPPDMTEPYAVRTGYAVAP